MSTELEERDKYEVANQLEGYVGPDTPEHLARFLMREGAEAAKLADTIVGLEAERDAGRKVYLTIQQAAAVLTAKNTALTAKVGLLTEALRVARPYVEQAVKDDGGIDNCEIGDRLALERLDAALEGT